MYFCQYNRPCGGPSAAPTYYSVGSGRHHLGFRTVMSIRFAVSPRTQDYAASSSSDSEDYADEDNNFEDWISDQGQLQACRSLFEDKAFATATEALNYDRSTHGFDLDVVSKQWSTSLLTCPSRLLKTSFKNRVGSSSSDTTDQFHSETCKIDDLLARVDDDRVGTSCAEAEPHRCWQSDRGRVILRFRCLSYSRHRR